MINILNTVKYVNNISGLISSLEVFHQLSTLNDRVKTINGDFTALIIDQKRERIVQVDSSTFSRNRVINYIQRRLSTGTT